MVDFRINWTLPIGAVRNSAYQPGERVETAQLETAPTRRESPSYRHIAPLGLNASMHHLIYHVSCSVFYPVNPLILRILIQTIIMSTPQLMILASAFFS